MTKKKDPKDLKKVGCPTMYTPELADKICDRIATHPLGLSHICEMYDDMPTPFAIREWRLKYPEFATKYLESKALQAMILVEEIDDLLNYEVSFITDEKGRQKIDPSSASIAIARCNNRKWMAARLAPRVFGENIAQKNESNTLSKESQEHAENVEKHYKKEY